MSVLVSASECGWDERESRGECLPGQRSPTWQHQVKPLASASLSLSQSFLYGDAVAVRCVLLYMFNAKCVLMWIFVSFCFAFNVLQ